MSIIPNLETQSGEKTKSLQGDLLQHTLKYVNEHSVFYQKLFAHDGIDITTIKSIEDIVQLPITHKDDLQNQNWDFLCVPKNRIAEYTSTSGTLGKPVSIALTKNDLTRLALNEYLSFTCADGSSEDIYQLAVTMDRQFMAGLAYYEGIRKLGAGLIRVGPGLPSLQWETIERLRPTVLVAVPSFIIKLIEFAKDHGISINSSSVKKIICIGESIRTKDLELNVLGKRIATDWDVQLFSTYASTEMQTAFTECSHGKGGHSHPELIYVELLDQNNQPIQKGLAGEITITTFGIEGMPLIRYKTGDMAIIDNEKCECGRTTPRLGPILGRKQQMIKLKGTSIYPPTVFEILNENALVQNYVVEVTTGHLGTDELTVFLFAREENKSFIEAELTVSFKSGLRVLPNIQFLPNMDIEQKQLSGNSRKINRFVDKRNSL